MAGPDLCKHLLAHVINRNQQAVQVQCCAVLPLLSERPFNVHPIPAQALKVLKDMQQRKAFTALLTVSVAEASKLHDKACSDEMQLLDLAMHIDAGTLPQAYTLAQQVGFPLCCVHNVFLATLHGSSTYEFAYKSTHKHQPCRDVASLRT